MNPELPVLTEPIISARAGIALAGRPVNAYVNEAEMPAVAKLTSIHVTKQNAAAFHPNY